MSRTARLDGWHLSIPFSGDACCRCNCWTSRLCDCYSLRMHDPREKKATQDEAGDFRQHGGLILFDEMRSKQGITFKIFTEEELQQATNKFSEQQVLGQGGYGTVYKGLLKGDVEVADKRCKTVDEQQKKEFGKEMLILSQVNHRNIVKLLGCCLKVEVPMLVY
ncbi:hypothetical protein VPH35_090641 [Triticum aestivum]|uniref:Protein kinase domain-containing protein n=1 Tax=Triticum turgidum subsp. durum TaxID=4567 RepID=A0A9R0XAV9_TRITD|nr:unnamed protein product [Triticum turgidum subsp. durum]